MDLTPEAVQAEMLYRTRNAVDPVELQHVREAKQLASPSWWRRLRAHRSQNAEHDDGNGSAHAA